MWASVAARKHTPVKVFPFGSGAEEVMLYGTVLYTMKDGKKVNVRINSLSIVCVCVCVFALRRLLEN